MLMDKLFGVVMTRDSPSKIAYDQGMLVIRKYGYIPLLEVVDGGLFNLGGKGAKTYRKLRADKDTPKQGYCFCLIVDTHTLIQVPLDFPVVRQYEATHPVLGTGRLTGS